MHKPAAPAPKATNSIPVNVFGQPIAQPTPHQPRTAAQAHPVQPTSGQTARPAKKRAKKSSKKKWLLLPIIVLLIGGGAASAWYFKFRKPSTPAVTSSTGQPTLSTAAPKPTGSIKVLLTGDFSAYDSVNAAAKTGEGYNYLPIMQSLKSVFDKYDLRICNQFTPGGGIGLGVSGYPQFNAPVEWSKGLEDLGCNIMTVGSSHTNDKGQNAITAALNYYDNHQNILATAGSNRSAEEQAAIRYFTFKQLKFAFLAYTTSSQKPPETPFGLNLYNAETAKKQVEEARKEAGFVIVAMNWGKEDSGDVQPDQEAIAQELVTAGADLIVGNGTHVVQPVKILNGQNGHQGLVWFSLGNAVNTQLPNENLFGGIGVVTIDVATGNMTDPGFLPTYMHYEWTQAEKNASRLDARKNLGWYPLDTSKDLLAKSLTNTTVEAQTERLKGIITKFAPIKMLTTADL